MGETRGHRSADAGSVSVREPAELPYRHQRREPCNYGEEADAQYHSHEKPELLGTELEG